VELGRVKPVISKPAKGAFEGWKNEKDESYAGSELRMLRRLRAHGVP
jgi:hypothetical protein